MFRFAPSARRVAAVVAGATIAVTAPTVALASSPATSRAAAHAASPKIVFYGGVTMLKLNPSTAQALTANGVSVGLASEARSSKSGLTFPIVGGVIDGKSLSGRIRHDGGLTFTAGGKSLTIRDFTINTTYKRLTAYVDEVKARITVLNLNFGKAKIALGKGTLSVRNVGATLNKQAAAALDGYFSTKLFTPGLPIGTARTSAKVVVLKG
jgi:Htaa